MTWRISALWMPVCLFAILLAGNCCLAQEDSEVSPAQPTENQPQETQPAEEPEALTFSQKWTANWDNEQDSTSEKWQEAVNIVFGTVVGYIFPVLFYAVPVGFGVEFPVVLLILIFGGVFFTLRFGFVNVRMFRHAIDVVRGRYDRPEDIGEVSHFQALTSALSATVGLGNIAGVAAAIAMGGPGAIFWMWVCAFCGMSLKFTSCSLAQYYRRVKPDGSVLGGPMVYLDDGIRDRFPSLAPLAKVFGVSFAIFTVFAAFGGGNMFQGNQTFKIVSDQFGIPTDKAWLVGIVMAALVGVVIIGGIRRIGEVTSKLVPAMCGFYCLICITILIINISQVPAMFANIFTQAFTHEAGFGGLLGIAILQGSRRAAFSNEAGLGSAAIAHAAAKTDEPIREGIVAMMGPFIDTIVVCTMTALTILVTNSDLDPATGLPFEGSVSNEKGVELTAAAFSSLGDWAPKLLCIAVVIFAYSTMISWSYYGERAIEYLFGMRGIKPYRVVYVVMVIVGPIVPLSAVIDFSDMMLFSMGFPNILGMILLSGVVGKHAKDYIRRLKSGQMKKVS
jgi:AGCS family alanine or glycine:cation symporter